MLVSVVSKETVLPLEVMNVSTYLTALGCGSHSNFTLPRFSRFAPEGGEITLQAVDDDASPFGRTETIVAVGCGSGVWVAVGLAASAVEVAMAFSKSSLASGLLSSHSWKSSSVMGSTPGTCQLPSGSL